MKNSLYIKLLLIIALVMPSAALWAQDSGIFGETTYIRNFKINEFGTLVFINDIAEDSNGSILLGTTDGMTMMCSQVKHYITTPNHSGISCIEYSRDGRIMISGDVDKGYFTFAENGKSIYHDLNENTSLKNETILQIAPCGDTYCYIGKNSIHILENDKTRKVKFYNIESSASIDSHPIVITKDTRVYTFDGKFTNEIAKLSSLGINDVSNMRLVDVKNDTILIISNRTLIKAAKDDLLNGKIKGPGDVVSQCINHNEINECTIHDAKFDSTINRLAISTNKGILIFNNQGKLINIVSTINGLPSNDAGKLFFDTKHNLWVCLRSTLSKIELNTHTVYYGPQNGLNGDVYCFEKYHDKYYCSTLNDVYTAEVDNHNTVFKPVSFSGKENIICLNIQTFCDHLLACTIDGLYEIEGAEARKILNTGKIYSLAGSPKHPNKIFMTSYDGLIIAGYREENGKLIFNEPYRVKGIDVPMWSILIDKHGDIWLSSIFNGIYYLKPNDPDIKSYSLVNIGENVNFKELRQPKFNITDKYLYTYGHELLRAEIPENRKFTANEIKFEKSSIFENYVKKFESAEIFPISNGNTFINTDNERIVAYRETKTFDTIHFQTKIDIVNNVFMLDSNMFLSTNIGLLKHTLNAKSAFNPGNSKFQTMIYGIYANDSTIYEGFRFFLNGQQHVYSMDNQNNYIFHSGIKSLKIKYTTSCFENEELLKYSYKLDGFNSKWSPYTSENSHNFGQLKPGKYTFRVKAKTHTGQVSEEAVYTFVIENTIWLRWWAIIIYISAFALLVYIVGRKLYFYKKENRRLDSTNKLLTMVASKNTNSVIILDREGNFQWANPSFANCYGYEFEEFKKIFGTNYFKIQKANSPEKANEINAALAENGRTSFVTMHTMPNGKSVYVQTHMDPVHDQNNKITNWIVTETDITQLKLAEKEGIQQTEMLVEAYSELKKNQSKMEFQTRQLKSINERLEKGYKQINHQNITINQSLKYAQGLQNSIMPSYEKISETIECSLMYWPKDIVSGDFYMCLTTSPNTFFTIVADCTGHGITGAFMSIIGYDILSQLIIYHRHSEPAQILELMSKRMIEMLDMKRIENTDGIALSICRIDKHDNHADLTFAGSDCSIYIQKMEDNTLTKFKGSRRQTGINGEKFNHKPFEQETIKISYNDRIIQYTDGIIDQCNSDRRRYGTPRFEKIITDHSETPITDICNLLEIDMTQFMGETKQRDDITVLIYKIRK